MGKAAGGRKTLSVFGATAMSMAMERGINEQKKLAAIMRDDEGGSVDHTRLSAWFRDVNRPPSWVCRSLAEALDLDEPRKIRLGIAFSFGYDRAIDRFGFDVMDLVRSQD